MASNCDMGSVPLFGIDFSGSANQWRSLCRRPNIWIATARQDEKSLLVTDLRPVQHLPGSSEPFLRLSTYLSQLPSGYAAIDAPFSVPSEFVGKVEDLWKSVSEFPSTHRPFGRGADLIHSLDPALAPRGRKMMRHTERYWQGRGVNTRSTTWSGPRGGAPFAVACMTLLARHTGRIWPFRMEGRGGCVLIEAFPAAQLRHWGLPHTRYNGKDVPAFDTRRTILNRLASERGLVMDEQMERDCIGSADALDAVICAFAAAGVASGQLETEASEQSAVEGLIAVHR